MGRRIGQLIVLEHEDHGQPIKARPVHGFVPIPPGGRSVAEERQRATLLASHLERHGEPDRDNHHVGQHGDHPDYPAARFTEVDISLAPAADRIGATHVVTKQISQVRAPDQVSAEVADEGRADRVAAVQRPRGSDAYRLLTSTVIERSWDLALFVQKQSLVLDGSHQHHVLEQARPVGVRELHATGLTVIEILSSAGRRHGSSLRHSLAPIDALLDEAVSERHGHSLVLRA
jgi:hypothetical protein